MSFTWTDIKKSERRAGELIEQFCKRLYLFELDYEQKIKANYIKYKIVEDHTMKEKHKMDLLDCLMKAGIELDHIPNDKGNESVLVTAASLDNVSLSFIEYLIENMHKNRCKQNRDGDNALLKILKSKNPNKSEIARKLINTCGNQLVVVEDMFLNTPLHIVADSGYTDLIPLLFMFGAKASLEKRDRHGRTPLLRAFMSQRDDMIELLIDKGANTNITIKGKSPLMMAVEEGNEKIVKKLFENPETDKTVDYEDPLGRTALLLNVAGNNPSMEIIRFLVDRKGAVLDVTDEFGNNALFYAVENGSIPLIKYILTAQRRRIKVNHKNNTGKTALFDAVISENPNVLKIIQLLIQHGADINATNKYGDSVLMNAITSKNKGIGNIIKLLINIDKIDVTHSNNVGRTVLHVGVVSDNENVLEGIKEILDEIKEPAAFINKQDFLGNTALHYALNRPNKELIKYLIEMGADINIKNNDGKSVKDLAKEI